MKSIVRGLKGVATWKENGMNDILKDSGVELWSE
jgi:hypothetical protein